MSFKHLKGMVISTTAILAGLVSFYTAWDVWLSKATFDISNQQAAASQWQKDYGIKIDALLQRNGVDPLIFKQHSNLPSIVISPTE